MRSGPERLKLPRLVSDLRGLLAEIPDHRTKNRIEYPMVDVVMGGLAMMFWQDPGVLPFQQRLQDQTGSSNLATLFSVGKVPGETQFRALLDGIDPAWITRGLRQCVTALQLTRAWREFRCLDGRVLVVIDGTEFFRSDTISCQRCLERHHRDGRVEHVHQVLVASIVRSGIRQVIPLMAEEIRREDGTQKQDCEINAAKRLLPLLAKSYGRLDIVLGGDSLYSKSPLIELATSLGMSFIFVAKPGDHAHLQEELAGLRLAKGITVIEEEAEDGTQLRWEFARDVNLFASTTVTGHWLAYTETKPSGEVGYRNTWVTNIKPTRQNIRQLAVAGRQRSKIENETFNALKNHGHHFEHNFGHGKQHLAYNFLLLNILSFLLHQLLSLSDGLYREALTWKGAVREFVDHIRWAIRLALWPDWETLINSFLDRGPRLRLDSG